MRDVFVALDKHYDSNFVFKVAFCFVLLHSLRTSGAPLDGIFSFRISYVYTDIWWRCRHTLLLICTRAKCVVYISSFYIYIYVLYIGTCEPNRLNSIRSPLFFIACRNVCQSHVCPSKLFFVNNIIWTEILFVINKGKENNYRKLPKF